jgi:hypothetical protein
LRLSASKISQGLGVPTFDLCSSDLLIRKILPCPIFNQLVMNRNY